MATANYTAPTGHLRPSLTVGHSGYANGCRCDGCKAGNREWSIARSKAANEARAAGKREREAASKVARVAALNKPGALSLQYVAGFFDGEGNVNIYVSRHKGYVRTQLRVSVGNTNRHVLELMREQFGGSLATRKTRTKPIHHFWRTGNAAVEFLEAIRPFLVVKAPVADLALEYWAFMQQPPSVRCDPIEAPGYRGAKWRKKPETVATELAFINRLKAIIDRGQRSSSYAATIATAGTLI